MTSLPPPSSASRSFVIPLGVMDVRIVVEETGDVSIVSPSPLPGALEEPVKRVLETWMIDWDLSRGFASTMIEPEMWRDYFGHRTVEVAHD